MVDRIIELLRIPEDLDPVPEELDGLVVDRYPIREGEGKRIRVYPFDDNPTSPTESINRHVLKVVLEIMVPIPPELAADQAVDPFFVWCIQRLFADRTLGGFVRTIQYTRGSWGAREGESPIAKFLLELVVYFQARADNPEDRV